MNSPDTIGCFSKSFLSWWQYPHWDSEKDGIILKSKVNYWRKQEKKKKPTILVPLSLSVTGLILLICYNTGQWNMRRHFWIALEMISFFPFTGVGKWLYVMVEIVATIFPLWHELHWHIGNYKGSCMSKLSYLMLEEIIFC